MRNQVFRETDVTVGSGWTGGTLALVFPLRAVGDQVFGRLALVAALGLGSKGALGRDVVGELATVVAPGETNTTAFTSSSIKRLVFARLVQSTFQHFLSIIIIIYFS